MHQLYRRATLAMFLLAAVASRAEASTVTGLAVSPAEAVAGSTITATVTGAEGYCGAVHIDWGDGNAVTYATERLPVVQTHVYKTGGTFTLRAQGMGNCTGEAGARVMIEGPAVVSALAAIDVSPNPATAKTAVAIALKGDGTCRVTLDFGDGNSQQVERGLPATVPHTYALPGTYTVAATPAAPCGGERRTARLEIVAKEEPARLTALEISAPPQAGAGRRSIRVAGQGRCSYTLDYGDGNTETRTGALPEVVEHNYPAPGRYEVVATATGPCSGVARSAVTIGSDSRGQSRDGRGQIARVEVRPQVSRLGDAIVLVISGSGTCRMTLDFDDGESRTVTETLPYRLAYRYRNPGEYEIVVWAAEPCSGDGSAVISVRR